MISTLDIFLIGILLCELQGYVFDAWMRMAETFDVLGEKSFAIALRMKAAKFCTFSSASALT